MAEKFHDKVVLVAGGTGALGRAVSLAFLAEGARVAVTYRQAKEFDALRTSAGERAATLTGHTVDVTDTAATEALAQKIVADQGRIDVLVNAVGAYAGGTPLWETRRRSSSACWRSICARGSRWRGRWFRQCCAKRAERW